MEFLGRAARAALILWATVWAFIGFNTLANLADLLNAPTTPDGFESLGAGLGTAMAMSVVSVAAINVFMPMVVLVLLAIRREQAEERARIAKAVADAEEAAILGRLLA